MTQFNVTRDVTCSKICQIGEPIKDRRHCFLATVAHSQYENRQFTEKPFLHALALVSNFKVLHKLLRLLRGRRRGDGTSSSIYYIRAKMLYALQHQPLYFMRSLAKSCQNDVLLEKAHSPAACILDFLS